MSDLKEETKVENTENQPAAKSKKMDTSMDGLQFFYEKNKKAVNYIGGGLVVLIGAIVFFKLYYIPEMEKDAANAMYMAEQLFENGNYARALKGDSMVYTPNGQESMKGFEAVADEYGMCRTGNLANYYAGMCLLRTGKFDEAIEYLKKYDNNDAVLAPIAVGAIGDCYMEKNNFDEAGQYYAKAADKVNNPFTTPYYLRKAALASELKKDYSQALTYYKRIQEEYPESTEGRDIIRYIARVKAIGNL